MLARLRYRLVKSQKAAQMGNKCYSFRHDLLKIWGQMMTMPLRFAVLLVLVFVLSACGLAVTPAPNIPTRVPPTPISTHLPAVATDIPAGFDENNPIQLVFVGASNAAVNDLEETLNALTEVRLSVVSVDTQAEAMALLCGDGTISAAWLNGMSYPAATQCGIVGLQAELGTERIPDTGEAGVLVVNAEFAEGGISAALEENFCRTSVNDFYGWLLPLMFFSAEDIDPTAIADIVEFESRDEMVAALASGECAALGMSETEWNEYLDSDTALADSSAIVLTSAEFPHHIMVFPFGADLEVINDIEALLLQLDVASGRSPVEEEEAEGTEEATEAAEATESAEISFDEDTMTELFGEGYLVLANRNDFGRLDSFLESTGLNFAEIGQ
jgi:hypothetical protein